MPPTDPDLEFLRRARDGDFEAFEKLVERHEGRLYGIAMRILRQREDAENVVQTTFLKVLENLKGFREESTFGTWVARIATHTALNVLRKRRGLPTVSLDQPGPGEESGEIPHPQLIAEWPGDPARIVEERELRRILSEAIESLPEKYRLVFILRDVEEFSVEETSKLLSITPANVKVRLLRARLALREKLAAVFGDRAKPVARGHEHAGGEKGSTRAEDLLEKYEAEGSGR